MVRAFYRVEGEDSSLSDILDKIDKRATICGGQRLGDEHYASNNLDGHVCYCHRMPGHTIGPHACDCGRVFYRSIEPYNFVYYYEGNLNVNN